MDIVLGVGSVGIPAEFAGPGLPWLACALPGCLEGAQNDQKKVRLEGNRNSKGQANQVKTEACKLGRYAGTGWVLNNRAASKP